MLTRSDVRFLRQYDRIGAISEQVYERLRQCYPERVLDNETRTKELKDLTLDWMHETDDDRPGALNDFARLFQFDDADIDLATQQSADKSIFGIAEQLMSNWLSRAAVFHGDNTEEFQYAIYQLAMNSVRTRRNLRRQKLLAAVTLSVASVFAFGVALVCTCSSPHTPWFEWMFDILGLAFAIYSFTHFLTRWVKSLRE